MKSYLIEEFGKPLQMRIRETPMPVGKEVVVRVLASGVCHTDLHVWQGFYDLGGGKKALLTDRGVSLPVTAGHEIYGEVVSVGPDVVSARVGDRKIVHAWIFCRTCEACRSDRELMCTNGRSLGIIRPGGFADHVLVEDERYLVDAQGLDPSWAATLACSGLTAYSALKHLRYLQDGDSLLIIGLGGLGLSAVNLACHVVQARIFGCDFDPEKRAIAESRGAAACFDSRAPGVVKDIRKKAGFGVLGVIDFVGSQSTAELALAVLRKGGTYVNAGMMGGAITIPLPNIVSLMLTIKPGYIGTLLELRELVTLVQEKNIQPIPIVIRPMSEVNQVLNAMTAGQIVGRTVLQP